MDSVDIQRIIDSYLRRLKATPSISMVKRYQYDHIDWDERVVAVVGARGVGKTTMLLQRIRDVFHDDGEGAIYISFDTIWLENNSLLEIVNYFYGQDIRSVYFDEVHRCQNWPLLLKRICDLFPDLNIVYAGLPLLDYDSFDVNQAVYRLSGLSFREYLARWYGDGVAYDPVRLEDLLNDHVTFRKELFHKVDSVTERNVGIIFGEYLDSGYHLYEAEDCLIQVEENVEHVMECDIPAVAAISRPTVRKLVKLFAIAIRNAPFKLNVSELADMIGATRAQTLDMLYMLEGAGLIRLLKRHGSGPEKKPEMVYPADHDLPHVFGGPDTSLSVHSAFFVSQVGAVASLEKPRTGADFLVDGKWSFVMGGYGSLPSKRRKEIPADCFFVTSGRWPMGKNEIPIWLFGFLY